MPRKFKVIKEMQMHPSGLTMKVLQDNLTLEEAQNAALRIKANELDPDDILVRPDDKNTTD